METINNLAMATFQLVILFTVAKFISFVKFNLRDYFIIVGIIIPTMFLYYFYGSRAVLIPTFSSIIFLVLCNSNNFSDHDHNVFE